MKEGDRFFLWVIVRSQYKRSDCIDSAIAPFQITTIQAILVKLDTLTNAIAMTRVSHSPKDTLELI
ncbi:hypothetical protein [Rivularia sp. UHCC 0363]|uniref:hypothetical protein n=1 Tax=Rivularia sp. UHCC 0363 TaxID=3110244 RepID=UPI002B1FAE9A|nr:hypothetical protein [Rivularia sp. UHCC 0363]MEA5599337.1 hypothetical protein [Rivularia sp. UHCC 0363]